MFLPSAMKSSSSSSLLLLRSSRLSPSTTNNLLRPLPCALFSSSVKTPTTPSPAAAAPSAPAITLYGFEASQPTRGILMLLKETKVPYHFIPIDYSKKDHKKPDFHAKNPSGLLPFIEDQGFCLAESGAILQYLADKNQLEEWYPHDVHDRALIHFWLHWSHFYTHNAMSQVLRRHLWPSSSSSKSKKAVNTLEESKAVLSKSLSFMEHKLEAASPEQKFLASKTHPTIADLLILPELDQQNLSACNLVDYSYFPKVQQWMENAKSSIQCYEEVFAPVREIAKHVRC